MLRAPKPKALPVFLKFLMVASIVSCSSAAAAIASSSSSYLPSMMINGSSANRNEKYLKASSQQHTPVTKDDTHFPRESNHARAVEHVNVDACLKQHKKRFTAQRTISKVSTAGSTLK